MDPSRSHILVRVINNCEGQYNTIILLQYYNYTYTA